MRSLIRSSLLCLILIVIPASAFGQTCGELLPPDAGTTGAQHDFPNDSPQDPVSINGQTYVLTSGTPDTTIQRFDGVAWQSVAGLPADVRITAITSDSNQLIALSSDTWTRTGSTVSIGYRIFRNTASGWVAEASGSTSRSLYGQTQSGISAIVIDPVRFGDWHVLVRINFEYCDLIDCNLSGQADTLARVSGSTATNLVEAGRRITDIATDGRAIYVGGEFTSVGVPGQPSAFSAPFLVRWTGTTTAGSNGNLNGSVTRLMAFNSNPVVGLSTMVVGGNFSMAGTIAASRIAIHDSVNGGNGVWSALGSGLSQPPRALISVSGGLNRNNVVAAHSPMNSFAHTFVRFSSGTWSSYAPTLGGTLNGLGYLSGQVLAVGFFQPAGEVLLNGVARLNGGRWLSVEAAGTNGYPKSMLVDGQDLFVGGGFTSLFDVPSGGIAHRTSDGVWHGLAGGVNGTVNAITRFGTQIVAGGAFSSAGGGSAANIAGWDGAAWQPLGAGLNGEVRALAVWNNQLLATGAFTASGATSLSFAAVWNGAAWSPLGSLPAADSARCIAVFNGQPHVGGLTGEVRRWDGANWIPIASHPNGSVVAMTPLLGSLYLGGSFSLPSAGVSRWTGSELLPVNGLNSGSQVRALAGDDDELFVAGSLSAGSSSHVAAWNGAAWRGVIAASSFSGGFAGPVNAIVPVAGGGWAAGELFNPFSLADSRFVAKWSDLPVITGQPQSVSLCGELPASVSFTVAPNNGQSVTLRWRKNGVSLTDTLTVSGSTLPTLTIFNLGAGSVGVYTCTVADACGNAITSAPAALTIGGPACCRADFNGDGTATVQDLFDFLNAFFAAEAAADFNGTGGVTVQDIFDFLDAWFAGCS